VTRWRVSVPSSTHLAAGSENETGAAAESARTIETVETNPFFRDAFNRTRCLIPVSGYFEWQDTPDGKQPCYFTERDGSLPLLPPASGTSGKIDRPESG
jgi:putative SOS response-associated peptidase YedK